MGRGAALLVALFAVALGGCGGGGGDRETTPPDATFPEPAVPTGALQAPKGATQAQEEIFRQFTPPKPDPRVPGSAKAIAAGRKACAARTAVEVERRYFPIAVRRGGLDPGSPRGKMIAEVGTYAEHAAEDPSFVAGQLAAGAYKATLPPSIASFGYAGCAYSLARQLEKEVAAR